MTRTITVKALLPAAANGGDGQDNVMVAKLQQQIAALMAQLQGLRSDRPLAAEKLRIDAFRAETDRLKLTADIAQRGGGRSRSATRNAALPSGGGDDSESQSPDSTGGESEGPSYAPPPN